MTQDRQVGLDAVRGIAIALVLVFHLRLDTGVPAIDSLLRPVIDTGWVGVDLFFVLSGYLVGRIILRDSVTPAGLDRRRFFVRRIARLWPVLYFYLAMLVATGGAAMVLPVVAHVQNYADHVPSHLWSLAVEEHFYLAAAFGLPVMLRRYGPRAVAMTLVAILVGCLALRLVALGAGVLPREVQWQTHYRADAIAAGVLIALAELYRPAMLDRVARCVAPCMIGAAMGFASLAAIPGDRFRYGIGLTIAYIASAMLVVVARRPVRLHGIARSFAWLGGIAYPLYIFHASIGRVADGVAPGLGLTDPFGQIVWRYAMVVIVAWIVAIVVERPLIRLSKSPWMSLSLLRTSITKPCQVRSLAVAPRT